MGGTAQSPHPPPTYPQEVDAAGEGEISIKVDGDDMMAGSGEFDGTPVASSPRVLAAQRTADDASSAMQIAERVGVFAFLST